MSEKITTITDQIKKSIENGWLRPYSALPTRRALAEEFNTTVDTIAKVLRDLEIEGFIVKGRGRTMRVSTIRERINSNDERFSDVMKEKGHIVKVEHIKTPGIVKAPLDIAKLARWSTETNVIERVRREIIDGTVYRYSRKVYLADLIPPEHLIAMQQDHAYNVRRELEEQRPLLRIEERIIARAITDKNEAAILGTIKGAPVLEMVKINYDRQKKAVWVSIVVMNAQYFVKQFDYAPGDEQKCSSFLVDQNN